MFIPVVILLAWAAYGGGLHAQTLHGIVRAADADPLPGANVYLPALQRGAVTDPSGRYEIDNLAVGTYEVVFSFIGFRSETRTVTVGAGRNRIEVTLQSDIVWTDEVLVAAEQEGRLTLDTRSVAILDAAALDEVRGQTLGETLEHLPGMTALQTGPSISKPVVRGLHSQRVLVLNAGVSQEGQQWGGEHAPEIDPFAPVRIEVIKGVAGVEYGVGAIGGVIRLEPLELPYVPGTSLRGQFAGNGFSNNRQGATALYLEGVANRLPGFGWRVQGSFRKAGDAQAPRYIIPNSAFQEQNGALTLGFRRGPWNLLGHISHFGTELGIFSGAHIGNLDDLLRAIERGQPSTNGTFGFDIAPPKQLISHDLASLRSRYTLDSGARFEIQYGIQRNHRQEFDAHRPYSDSLAALDRPAFELSLFSQSVEARFHHRPVGRFFGVMGVSGMNQLNLNGRSGFLIPNFRSFSSGVFARETWVNGDWQVEAGARYDYRWVRAWPRENGASGEFVRRVNDYGSLSAVFGAIWQFAPAWSLATNVGTAWRPPSVNEHYNFGVHHGTAQFEIGDPDLEAERSLGLDATLRHDIAGARLEVSAYSTQFQRFIYLYPDPSPRVTIRGTFPTFRYAQADARLNGFDASVEYDLNRILTLGMVTSVVRGQNLDDDEPLYQMPGDRLRMVAHVNLPGSATVQAPHFEVESAHVARQSRFTPGVDYAEPPPGYHLINASFATDLLVNHTPVHVHLSVQNALDTVYRDYLSRFRYFIDDPGRSFVLRLSVPIGAPRV
ncbi:MAG: TonB-dependent receptor [Rhodothermales bacterium]|nr:TonB-dependent receptor [Rhodothermales bacterium]